jgi:hypothetical protein
MINSRFKFLAWQSFFMTSIFFVIVTILAADTLSHYFFGVDIIRKADEGKNQGFLLLLVLAGFVAILFNVFTTLRFVKVILIDTNTKTISFKNILTKNTKVFLIKNFDGYYNITKTTAQGYTYKEILLIKDGKLVEKISQYFYRNYDELADPIQEVNSLGVFAYGFQERIRMLLGLKI